MKCIKCKKDIPQDKTRCLYCGTSITEAKEEQKRFNEEMQDRFYQIDDAYGLKVDFVRMSTEKLETFFDDIYTRFEKDRLLKDQNQNNFEKIFNHLNKVDEELQKRYPVREEVLEAKKSGETLIDDLLDKYNPPQVYAAAFQIRSNTEALLRDKFNFKYKEEYPYGFVKKYNEIFLIITKDKKDTVRLLNDHSMLNKFIHKSQINDKHINSKFPTMESKVKFIREAYKLRKKYNLI